MIKGNKILLDEYLTFVEASTFGLDKNGNYSSQLGNDDIMMTLVNLMAYLESSNFYETVEDIIDSHSQIIKSGIEKRLVNVKDSDKDDFNYAFLKDLFN